MLYFYTMKYTALYLILISVCVASCKDANQNDNATTAVENFTARDSVTIEINRLVGDSTSVRALDYRNDAYHYAGSKGKYGKFLDTDGGQVNGVIETDSLDLEFRAIAVTDNFTFLMNVGSPAYIFKINHETQAVLKVYEESGEGVFYDSLKFWNDQEGIAMGDPTSQGDKKCISIIKTEDGGQSWKKISCENIPEFIEGEAGFAASNSNISIQGDQVWIATGGKAARVLHSKDRGTTWIAQETPIVAGLEMTGIFAMDFYDQNTGAIIGGNWSEKGTNSFNKARTNNSGATWELLDQGNGPGYCSDILFIPDTQGRELLAVGTPGIWWSNNQGASWKKISDDGYYTVAMKDSNSGMLMGYNKMAQFELR